MLAFQIAFGNSTQPDREGVLREIARRPLGQGILIVMAAGFAGYALWRYAMAVLGPRDGSGDAETWGKRAGYLGRALLYTGFLAQTILLMTGLDEGGSSTEKARRSTDFILHVPGGRWVVIVFGAAVLATGLYNAYRAISGKWREEMKEGGLTKNEKRWMIAIAAAGLAGRAIVFTLIGIFFIRAGFQFDPQEAVGFDGALRKVADAPLGPLILSLVAAATAAFGVFSLVQARYRKVFNS